MLERTVITTGDGSKTIQIPAWNEQYHSTHGALQEAKHVFLSMGLDHLVNQLPTTDSQPLSILEMGFGTGLNALLTYFHAIERNVTVEYTAIEAFPISQLEVEAMEYGTLLSDQAAAAVYNNLHAIDWEINKQISPTFHLTKKKQLFEELDEEPRFDLIYFDAFGPRVQPDLWKEAIFSRVFDALKEGGVLTTYCAQGAARRAMQAVGFIVERLPGPPGKREMLRATKPH